MASFFIRTSFLPLFENARRAAPFLKTCELRLTLAAGKQEPQNRSDFRDHLLCRRHTIVARVA
jgi:hypothetical protein